jgi:hypothetical protein
MKKSITLIIIVLILSIVLVSGCLDQPFKTLNDNYIKIKTQFPSLTTTPSIPKSQPCIVQTSSNGGFIGTITQGDCSKSQKNGLDSRIIGKWNFKSDLVEMKFIFNDDGTGTLEHSQYGKSHFKYQTLNNKLIFSDTDGMAISFFASGSGDYKLYNNEISIMGLSFEKSWW